MHSNDNQQSAVIRTHSSIAEIDAGEWDARANPRGRPYHPFVSHAFLNALEQSGSVGEQTGWLPTHLTLQNNAGEMTSAAPCYLKMHSQGEYVFDYAWADAYERAGGRYYPKLQIAVPFTPVPGPRFLTADGPDHNSNIQLLASGAVALAEKLGISGVHATFVEQDVSDALSETGFLLRDGQQFHWANSDYSTFDDFLASLSSRKRKMIRKERKQALEVGLQIECLQGHQIQEAHWDAMFAFYMDTGERKWGRPYLNRTFFSLLGEAMPEACLLVFAKRNDEYIAGALNLIGGDCLYGRYWGTTEHLPCLHFELCYYQAIEYAIRNRLSRVEAGAQGEHKLARGYLPVATHSVHWLRDPAFSNAVEEYLEREKRAIQHINTELSAFAPYKKA